MKEVLSINIEKEIKDKLNKYCEENLIHKPSLIEKLLSEYLRGK
jgi:hypothetical protein